MDKEFCSNKRNFELFGFELHRVDCNLSLAKISVSRDILSKR